ncbi:potassium channel family protein [Caldalkalibacillus salinus]|uniref:potassium channel family protein n=1 Tax=Caldalkalibacillus salinus TaxID=2803787 RepID=UPI001921EA21|nr:TrkA family potassium uptake protein [Caldalkalibacillus salinus]
MKKQFVVIGLGRFGGSITKTLVNLGHEVLAIDKDESKIQEFSSVATQAVQANSIDEQAMKQLGIRNFDHAIIAIGDDIQASILTTLILKDMGVRKVSVKATNDYHSKVLEKIGADRIIHPERDMGVRAAHHIVSENVIDYIELSPEYSLVEIAVTDKMHQKTLGSLDIRARYGCNVMAIKTYANDINVSPRAEDVVYKGDILVIIGSNKDINHFEDTLDN